MDQNTSDGGSSMFGLRVGTHEAVLAINQGGDRRILKSLDGNPWIPVQLGISNKKTGIIDTDGGKKDWKISVSLEEPFEADPTSAGDDSSTLLLKYFLEEARQQWLNDTELQDNHNRLPVTVSIPGAYDKADEDKVMSVVEAAGFHPLGAVREPIGTGYEAGVHTQTEGKFLLARVGSYWFDVAIVEPDTNKPQFETIYRASLPDLGSDLFERTITEWLISTHEDKLSDFEKDNLRIIVRDSVEAISKGSESVQLGDDVNIEFDNSVLDRSLEGVINDFGKTLRQFLEDSGVNIQAIEATILTGPGAHYPVVQRTFSGAIDSDILHLGGPERPWDGPSARGATKLGTNYGTKVNSIDSSLRRPLAIEVLTPRGSQYKRVDNIVQPTEEHLILRTTEDDQTRGKFRVGSMHRSTGEVELIKTFEINKIPPAPAGEIGIEVRLEPTDNIPTDCGINVSFKDQSFETDIEVESRPSNITNGPWFINAEQDLSNVEVPDREQFEPAYKYDPNADAYDSLSPKQAIDRMVNIRNEFWSTAKEGLDLSADELSVRVQKLDIGLKRSGIELIEPDIGEIVNDVSHQIVKVKSTGEPEGTIINVRTPGYRIDGQVESKASVVISSGPPEENTEETTEENRDNTIKSDSTDDNGSGRLETEDS